jgi:hypothetical protein
MKRMFGVAALAVLMIAGLSCGDSTGARPGTLSVRLTTQNSGLDSAMVLTITGPAPLTSATAGAGLREFHQAFTANSTPFALTGQLNQGAIILTIGVQDVGAVSQYSGTIQGVAQSNYQLRVLPGGYAVAITR